MFYSHEILTSRKYGVATVWLVATLGQKSSLKRINRKQILEVDVPKACQTIVDPVAPMALRLQGNLLYGISRVYLQQCGYVLSDAQIAQNELQMMLRTVKDAALDPDAGRARPEQLILQDDPSFLPDFTLPPPELLAELDSRFNLDIVHSGESQSLTPFCSQQSQDSSHVGVVGGLVLPTSSPGLPGQFRLEGDDELGGLGGPSAMLGDDDMVEIEDPDFMFGDDGEIVHLSPGRRSARTPVRSAGTPVSGDAGTSARVRREHKEGRQAIGQFPGDQEDIQFPVYNEELPEDEVLSSDAPQQSSEHAEIVESSESFSAPLRRRRVARTLPTDATTELRNKVLADWNTNYRANMKAAARQKIQYRATVQAKKNAEHYVWNSGIGDIGQRIFGLQPNPFNMFIGDGLFESITGLSHKKAGGTKHDRDSGIDDATQEESRRVRQKTEEPEFGRGGDEEGFLMPGDDDAVELPREAASALDDQQIFSAMPWNMSASIRGSSAIPRSGRVGMMGSAEQGRPISRLVSASPLHGRGQPSVLEAFPNFTSDADFGGDDFGLPGLSSDLPQPAAAPEVSTRVREALSTEGANFVTFINDRIMEKRSRTQDDMEQMSDVVQAEAAADIEKITFEELLPPNENTKMIACQGLMMVLALGTKGMLKVQQPEHLGDISLKLTDKAKAMQVVEISDGEESGGEKSVGEDGDGANDEGLDLQEAADDLEAQDHDMEDVVMEEEEEGHFQEQFSAGHAAQEEDDRDLLYDD
ncbi:Rad21 Rec8 N domain containing protein [Pyrenophora teres f. maculata]|nr:Rad21 Rec8 N domain containing protein [Pyrenophora teres f. maculata]